METNSQVKNIFDQLRGIYSSIDTLGDQIKAFNKKLATSKVDNSLMLRYQREFFDKGFTKLQQDVEDLEDQVKEMSPRIQHMLVAETQADQEKDSIINPI